MRAFSENQAVHVAAEVRPATPDDAPAIAAIYAPIVIHTAITFEEVAPSAADVAQRIVAVTRTHPWLVAQIDGLVVGYAYASPHGDRAGYRWAANVSVYLAAEARGLGIGRQLYERLFSLARRLGFYRLYAGVKIPNPASEGLHRALGFVPVGTYRRIGYKFDRWHDVRWFELVLREDDQTPSEPIPWPLIRGK